MAGALAQLRPLAGALERYRRQFPRWSIVPVAEGKGYGYTAHAGQQREWGPDLLTMAQAMAAATGTLTDAPAALAFPGRPGYVAGNCGHPMPAGEWQIGFRTCGNCPPPREQ